MASSPHLQQSHIPPEFVSSSIPLNSNPDFTNFDPKTPLINSIPQELVPLMPYKSMNMMSGGLFSSSSGSTLFGPQRSIPSSSSSSSSKLQLTSNNSSSESSCLFTVPAHMSATALLQKAAQMGSTTASNTVNSPLTQKNSFTSSSNIANSGPHDHDQISSYNVIGVNRQSNMVGIQFANQILLQRGSSQDMSQFSDGSSSAMMNDMGIFNSMFMSSSSSTTTSHDQQITHQAFLNSKGKGGVERNLAGSSRFGGSTGGGGNDTMAVDFMGIGGRSSMPAELHEQLQHQQQQQLEAMRLQPMMDHLQQQQQLSHDGESAMEKIVWDV